LNNVHLTVITACDLVELSVDSLFVVDRVSLVARLNTVDPVALGCFVVWAALVALNRADVVNRIVVVDRVVVVYRVVVDRVVVDRVVVDRVAAVGRQCDTEEQRL